MPVWGAGRAAVDHFQNGNYWRGTAYAAIAITDVFLIKAAVTAVAKIGATAVVEVSAKEVAEEVVAKEGIFFEGTSYSPKVLKQMSVTGDMFHAFPKSVDGFATKFGQFSTKLGIDGKSYQSLEMSGSYGGKTGRLNTLKIQTGLLIIDFSMSLKYRSMKIISNYLNFIKEKGKPLSEINPGSDEIALTVTMLHEHWNY